VACPSKAKQNKNPKLLFDIKKKDYENTEWRKGKIKMRIMTTFQVFNKE
jgi:hypothetical protein